MNAQKIPEQKSKALTGVNGDPNKTNKIINQSVQ